MKYFILINILFIVVFIYWLNKDKKRQNPSKLNFNRKTPIDTFESVLKDKSENNEEKCQRRHVHQAIRVEDKQ